MENRELQPSSEHLTLLNGRYIDIDLIDPNSIQEFLAEREGAHVFIDSTEYPFPLERLVVRYHEDEDVPGFAAHLQIDRQAASDALYGLPEQNWKVVLSEHIQNALAPLGYVIHKLNHEDHNFHIVIDDDHALRVEFATSPQECVVTATTIQIETLGAVMEGPVSFGEISAENFSTETGAQHLLENFLEKWALIFDEILDIYEHVTGSSNWEKIRIPIAAPVDSHPSEEDKLDKTVTSEPSTAQMDTIGGLRDAKEQLESIATRLNKPDLAALYDLRPKHILLYGPPGTGKTSLVHAFANLINADLVEINSAELVDKWVGESAKNTQKIFDDLASREDDAYVVLFFDEFDALAKCAPHDTAERVDVKKQLLAGLDRIKKDNMHVIVLAATNSDIQDLEPALVRSGRFKDVAAPVPTEEERVEIWSIVLTNHILKADSDLSSSNLPEIVAPDTHDIPAIFMPYDDDLNPVELAKITDGMTGADFETILEQVREKAFMDTSKNQDMGYSHLVKITQADIVNEIRLFRR